MANYTTNAINLKAHNLNEADKIITLYSRDYGLIKCVAKGAKKTKSRLGGKMDLFVANKIFAAKGKSLDVICQADLLDGFLPIKKDYTKLSYAFYCTELVSSFALENDPNSKEIYDIFYAVLEDISAAKTELELLWTVIRFKLALIEEAGYAVQTDFCVKCNNGADEFSNFSIEIGGVICNSCRRKIYKISQTCPESIEILKYAKKLQMPHEKFAYDMIISTFNLLREYISFRANKKLKTPDMIGSI